MNFVDYERYVVKSLLLWPSSTLSLVEEVERAFFSDMACYHAFGAIRNLQAAGEPIGVLQVADELNSYAREIVLDRVTPQDECWALLQVATIVTAAPLGVVEWHYADPVLSAPPSWTEALDRALFDRSLRALRVLTEQRGELGRAHERSRRFA